MEHPVFKWLNRLVLIIFLTIIALIVALNIYTNREYQSVELETPSYFNEITAVLAFLIFISMMIFQRRILTFINKLPFKQIVVICLLIISFLLQLITVWKLNVNPSWDFGTIVKSSIHLVEGQELSEYFIMYPNNILLTCILAVIGKLVTPTLLVFQLFNLFIITISQFLIYRITTKLAGKSVGIISLLMSVIFFPYIFFAPIVYTDTISLIFLLGPLNLLISKQGKMKKDLLTICIVSVIFSAGMILKGSLIIFLIAFSIVLLLYLNSWKKLSFVIPFIILLIVKSLFNFGVYESEIIDKHRVERYSFPVTHWIVMAQNEKKFGKYSAEDFQSTYQLLQANSKDKVKNLHIKELKKRLNEKGLIGNLKFNIEKISHTWTDGTYYSLNKLRRVPVHPENYQHLIDGKSGKLLLGYARVQHLLLLAGLLLIFKYRKEHEFLTFAMLAVVGFFLFFLIWETRSRYLVSLTPLLIILSCIGYFGFNKEKNSIKD